MSYFLKSSNLSSIQSAIEEFKQVILVQNQVITNLQTALNASLLRVDALETTTASNTSAISTGVDELAATNRTVLSNTTNLSTSMTNLGNLQPVIASHTSSLATLQSQVTTNTSDLTAKTTQISVINSIQGGHTTSIGVNYNEIFRLNGVSLNHATLLTGLRTDVDSGSGSQADIAALQSDVSSINTTLAAHDVRISYNLQVFTGFLGASQSLVVRLNAVEADLSTINTTLTAHDSRIFTNTTDIFQLQTNGHEGRLDSAEATVLTLVTDVGANTTLVNNLLSGLQIFGRSLTAVEASITTLRTDVDANTLSNTQFLNALQYQSTSIFAIDTAIQGLNVQVGSLETTQVTHDGLIREFDQEFNDPVTGVIFKIDSLTTTYDTHIDGVFLTIRQNVDSNNLILGTLSTQTTSLLTAMTQLVPKVDTNQFNVIVNQNAISTLGTTAGSNTTRLDDLETRIEDLEAA
jgi:chromosome segregation ATPase